MHITQAILPVAGLGTRFLPWTKVVPKELLPIGSKPIIAHLVDEALDAGITDLCFVISRGKELIPQFFFAQPELERQLESRGKLHLLEELRRYDSVRLHVVYQEQMLGDGHAILQAQSWVNSPTVAILFGDDLIVGKKTGLAQLIDAFQTVGSPAETAMLCLEDIDRTMTGKYGIVDIAPDKHKDRIHRVIGLVEKPQPDVAPSTLGIVGKYLIPQSTFTALSSVQGGHTDQEIRLIDALKAQLAAKEMSIYGWELEGKRFDTGSPSGYKEAVKAIG